MAQFDTKFGTFDLVSTNNKNGVSLHMQGVKITEYPKTPMWNLDEISRRLNEDEEVIRERIKERVKNKK